MTEQSRRYRTLYRACLRGMLWSCVLLLICVPVLSTGLAGFAWAATGTPPTGEAWKKLTEWQDMPPLYKRAALPATLEGKTLVLVWNGKHNSDRLLRVFARRLGKAVPGVCFAPTDKPIFFSPICKDMSEAEKAVKNILVLKPQLVILATGDCRVCAAWMAVEAVLLEKASVATVALVTQPFYKTYQNVCRNMRMEPLTCIAVPHPVAVISAEKVDAKASLFFEEFQKLFSYSASSPHADRLPSEEGKP